MRQALLLATWTFIGAMLVISGVYLVLPGRNALGDPRREREMASCVLPDDAEVRLYQSMDTPPASTWYSVTHEPKGLEPERQIVYRLRSPALYDLVCDTIGVVIRTDGEPMTLTAQQARALRGTLQRVGPPRTTRWIIGGVLALAGLALLWFLRPKPGDEALF